MDFWIDILILLVRCLVLALAATTLFAYFTLFERRLLAKFQHRVGPNRAGYIPLPGGKKTLWRIFATRRRRSQTLFQRGCHPSISRSLGLLDGPRVCSHSSVDYLGGDSAR